MNLLYHQTFFCPDKNQFNRCINSLCSLQKYLQLNHSDNLLFCFAGFCIDEFWQEIEQKIKDIISINDKCQYKIFRFTQNYGKAIIANSTINKLSEFNFTDILFLDSDICLLQNSNLFERLNTAKNKLIEYKQRPLGVLALNQLGTNVHYASCKKNIFDYYNSDLNILEQISWPNIPSGIGGGCFLTERRCWEKIGGYEFRGVYCGEDAYYLLACGKLEFSYQIINTLSIIHPEDTDANYDSWKKQIVQINHISNKKDIDYHLIETNKFWQNREKGN